MLLSGACVLGMSLLSRDAQAALGPDYTWNISLLPVHPLDLAAPLQNGKVLLRHNEDQYFPATDYLYDPATNALGGVLGSPKSSDGSRLTALPSGDVLLSGRDSGGIGSGLAVYGTAANTYFTKAPLLTPRLYHTATILPNGRVLIAGGFDALLSPMASAETYDPATDMRSPTGSMAHPRGNAAAILLDDGRVLVAGGMNIPPGFIGPAAPIVDAEVYDPGTGMWSPAGTVPPHLVSALARLPDGKVLMAGGFDFTTVTELNDAVIFDPGADAWSPAADMPAPLMGLHHMPLPDGRVLVTGYSYETDMYLYDEGADAWSPADSSQLAFIGQSIAGRPSGELVLVAPGSPDGVQIYGPDTDLDGYNDLREGQLGENASLFCKIMRADVNSDSVVNSGDQLRMASAYGMSPRARLDQNGDGVINSGDQLLMASIFNKNVAMCP
jgi:hypothetical protein